MDDDVIVYMNILVIPTVLSVMHPLPIGLGANDML